MRAGKRRPGRRSTAEWVPSSVERGAACCRTLQLVGDLAEGRAQICADEGESGDCRDGNQCGDQCIFDGCNPRLVSDQAGKKGAQADSPRLIKTIARRLRENL